ncbi:LutC/YkgG family protein [Paenibacillus sp. MMS18-CY102]|uniref:LutC/YkgG family protein n=1 Tax=Paenibacillus sp. MMS18-CY102 TaxID=2682849 RepID=UPI001366211C|nr:LUD domain-containing protein [Paenibacillus sp. MMS18-CY102]MWC29270.1 lactate utilization protein C [Paenibacillus sp. MMS18-CY102]
MAGTHDEWLEQMETASRAKQQAFIDGLAAKLKRPRIVEPPHHPFRGAPDFWRSFEWPIEERIDRFGANFRAAGGYVERLADLEEAKRFIADKAAELGARHVVRQRQPELDAMGLEEALPQAQVKVWNSDGEDDWLARAAEADFGIVAADYAVAYTGSLAVLSSKDKGRSVSLLPTVLFALISIERLKTRIGEPLKELDRIGREQLPAGIHFISGPSRSADIENDLTIGVHGPGIVYALIIG